MDRFIHIFIAAAMTFAAICFAGITALLTSVIISPTGNAPSKPHEWLVIVMFVFLTVISSVIAMRFWRRRQGAVSVIPLWVIQATGVFMLGATIALLIAGKNPVFLYGASTVFGGMIFCRKYFDEPKADS